jgi:hypothetical protein
VPPNGKWLLSVRSCISDVSESSFRVPDSAECNVELIYGAIQYQNYKVSLVFISYCCNTEPLSSIGKTESSLALKELAIHYPVSILIDNLIMS